MKIAKSKTLAIAIATLLTFSMTASMVLVSTASAHTPAWSIPTVAFIYASPNPIGVNQSAFVDMWLDKVLPGAEPIDNIRWQNYKLTITAPNGAITTQTWAVVSDPTANQDYHFTPTQIGTYNLTFTFPGQVYTWTEAPSFPFGILGPTPYTGDIYLASNASTTLTVQSTPIAAIPSTPLPTQYWTRPIYGENPNWYTISSNYFGRNAPSYPSATSGLSESGFVAGAVGPLTGHIMWTKPLDSGGVVGGTNFVIAGDTYTDGSAYSARYTNPIIMDGMLYYTEPLGYNDPTGGPTVCVNLQTGQLIWSSATVDPTMPPPTFGYIYDIQDPNQHGATIPLLIAQSGGPSFFPGFPSTPITWQAFDGDTGALMFTVTNIPPGATTMGPNGETLSYVLANDGTPVSPSWYLAEWNSSRLWDNEYSGPSTTPSNAPPITDGSNPSLFDWNVSIPSLNTLTTAPTIFEAYYGDMLLCMNGTYPGFASLFSSTNSFAPYTYFAINLNPSAGAMGSILWRNMVSAPPGNLSVSFNGADPTANGGAGVFTEFYSQTMQFVGYSMATGKQLWGPVNYDTNDLAFYNEGFPCAYGELFQIGYGGVVYAYDETNGKLLWTYGNGGAGNSTSTGLAFTYPHYPAVIYAIGNGVIYMVTSEHDVETPIYKGALARAINATTGQEIWTLSDDDNGLGVGNPGGAIADGYATFFNAYDNQIYVVGRGPSETTVSTPQVGITTATPITITGLVTDISAGTTQTEQTADFPHGVPCASDASMQAWMGYVYQQQPEPTNFVGVQVTLSVTDSNNNHYVIGTATTDESGTYSLTWTPPIPGNFTVYANFLGTKGYWPSSAEAHIYAGSPAPTASPYPSPVTGLASTGTVELGIAAVVIVIVIIGIVLAILTLRKRP